MLIRVTSRHLQLYNGHGLNHTDVCIMYIIYRVLNSKLHYFQGLSYAWRVNPTIILCMLLFWLQFPFRWICVAYFYQQIFEPRYARMFRTANYKYKIPNVQFTFLACDVIQIRLKECDWHFIGIRLCIVDMNAAAQRIEIVNDNEIHYITSCTS